MARSKPSSLCVLEKGKIIDAQKNFVDTFNWAVSILDDLTKGLAKIEEVKIVTGMKYDETTHKFTVKTRKSRVIVIDSSASDSTVFEATPLTGES